MWSAATAKAFAATDQAAASIRDTLLENKPVLLSLAILVTKASSPEEFVRMAQLVDADEIVGMLAIVKLTEIMSQIQEVQ